MKQGNADNYRKWFKMVTIEASEFFSNCLIMLKSCFSDMYLVIKSIVLTISITEIFKWSASETLKETPVIKEFYLIISNQKNAIR
jgi:hypothetical protein